MATDVTVKKNPLIEAELKAVEAYMRIVEGFIKFDGQNCDGPCSGWDMKSNRCDCGNRRVAWASDPSSTVEHPLVNAEAY